MMAPRPPRALVTGALLLLVAWTPAALAGRPGAQSLSRVRAPSDRLACGCGVACDCDMPVGRWVAVRPAGLKAPPFQHTLAPPNPSVSPLSLPRFHRPPAQGWCVTATTPAATCGPMPSAG